METAHPVLLSVLRDKIAAHTLVKHFRSGAPMINYSIVNTEPATEERRARGQAGRIRNVTAIKLHALRRHAVDAGARRPVIAIAAEMVGSQRIDIKIEDAHREGDDQKKQHFGLIAH